MPVTIPTVEDVRAIVREELARVLVELRKVAPPVAEWATPEQAAALLARNGKPVTPKTVRRWAASGRLRATRHGRSWRIDRAALPAAAADSPGEHARLALDAMK
jgi:excisionase family DNA binding protein